MESALNVRVSKFENYFQPEPTDTILWQWLKDRSQDDLIEALRTIEDKKERDALKAKLSCVTVSGRFENPRSLATIIEHSGLMCIDVDPKENPNIENYDQFKEIVGKAPFVAYAALSASGKGYFLIIPIEHPEKHVQHFLALEILFEKIGVKIDKACKDVSRLRGRTFDPDPYINHQAKKFTALLEPPKPKPRNSSFKYQHLNGNNTQAAVERRIQELQKRRVDLTSSYHDWVTQGFAIASEFGENGRDYFHDVSSIHPEYNADECDKQYDKCVKGRGNGVTIASFFFACNAAGVELMPPLNVASFPEKETPGWSTQGPEKQNIIADIQPVKPRLTPETDSFDVQEYRKWLKTLQNPPKIRLESLIDEAPFNIIYNAKAFATGRLNSILAWSNSRNGTGHRSLHIRQLIELRQKSSL